MKKQNKKGSFDVINQGMIAFIGFVLIAVLAIILIGVTIETDMICTDGGIYDGENCIYCPITDYTYSNSTCCNNTGAVLSCTTGNSTTAHEWTSAEYNATKDLREASMIAPQFSQIIVIVIIVVGILGLLSLLGYSAYKKMKG